MQLLAAGEGDDEPTIRLLTIAALVGGGSRRPHPGEATLAHPRVRECSSSDLNYVNSPDSSG
jgi:hypothetical protein